MQNCEQTKTHLLLRAIVERLSREELMDLADIIAEKSTKLQAVNAEQDPAWMFLSVSFRTKGMLRQLSEWPGGPKTIQELSDYGVQNLRRVPNVGTKTISEIREALASYNLSFT